MPRLGNRFTRWIGCRVFGLLGWRVAGTIPDRSQLVVAAGPHTSNWDFILAVSAILGLGVRLSFLMKQEAFFWPFKGLFQWFGGIPTDRGSPHRMVAKVAGWYRDHPQLWVGMTPEGTRSKVQSWKTGFVRIAHAAGVPVLLVALDYPSRTLHLCQLITTSGHHERDAAHCRALIDRHFIGRHPEKQ
ncbi:acyltransferase [Exilibacterium tricleocarpae]|uniref:Acyltransferase n=2 Tax=Exilibacterium tricleocarpae TaxID=2591008 RepID=A0A545TSK7_9GAMM|nr:acyltransferase [Exilibacterium tricleocarpae]